MDNLIAMMDQREGSSPQIQRYSDVYWEEEEGKLEVSLRLTALLWLPVQALTLAVQGLLLQLLHPVLQYHRGPAVHHHHHTSGLGLAIMTCSAHSPPP